MCFINHSIHLVRFNENKPDKESDRNYMPSSLCVFLSFFQIIHELQTDGKNSFENTSLLSVRGSSCRCVCVFIKKFNGNHQ